jgi:hypothetical protein
MPPLLSVSVIRHTPMGGAQGSSVWVTRGSVFYTLVVQFSSPTPSSTLGAFLPHPSTSLFLRKEPHHT